MRNYYDYRCSEPLCCDRFSCHEGYCYAFGTHWCAPSQDTILCECVRDVDGNPLWEGSLCDVPIPSPLYSAFLLALCASIALIWAGVRFMRRQQGHALKCVIEEARCVLLPWYVVHSYHPTPFPNNSSIRLTQCDHVYFLVLSCYHLIIHAHLPSRLLTVYGVGSDVIFFAYLWATHNHWLEFISFLVALARVLLFSLNAQTLLNEIHTPIYAQFWSDYYPQHQITSHVMHVCSFFNLALLPTLSSSAMGLKSLSAPVPKESTTRLTLQGWRTHVMHDLVQIALQVRRSGGRLRSGLSWKGATLSLLPVLSRWYSFARRQNSSITSCSLPLHPMCLSTFPYIPLPLVHFYHFSDLRVRGAWFVDNISVNDVYR